MTKAEKRYFRLVTQTFRKNPEHLRLFDFLLKQKEWNSTLLQSFESGFSGNSAALKKRYLKTQILATLRSFNKDRSSEIVTMNLLLDVEILYQKKMFQECIKTLGRAKSLASKHEIFGLYLEVLSKERRLISSTLSNLPIGEEAIASEEFIVHKKYLNVIATKHLYSSVVEFKKKHGYLRDEVKKKELKVFFNNYSRDSLDSKRSEFYYFQACAIYYWMLSEHEESYYYASKITFEFNNVVSEDNFFFGILEVLTACICTHRYQELLDRLEYIEKSIHDNQFSDQKLINDRFYYYKNNYSIIACAMLGEMDKLASILSYITNDIYQKSHELAEQMILVLKSTVGHGWFILGEYDRSKKAYFEILNSSKINIRNDIYSNAKVFFPLILFELEEYDLMLFEANSSLNHFSSNRDVLSLEYFIVNELVKINTPSSIKEQKRYAKKIINRLVKELEKTAFGFHFEFYVLLFWAKSKVNSTEYRTECIEYFA